MADRFKIATSAVATSIILGYAEKRESHRVCSTKMPDVLEGEVWNLKEIREAQMNDPDIAPVLQWFEESSDRPDILNVTCLSANTKLYWAQ